jgi:hypothetical protein
MLPGFFRHHNGITDNENVDDNAIYNDGNCVHNRYNSWGVDESSLGSFKPDRNNRRDRHFKGDDIIFNRAGKDNEQPSHSNRSET